LKLMKNVVTVKKINACTKIVVYGDRGELLALNLPRTTAMNAAFDSLISFAETWLCDPNCPAALLAWDTTDDDYIDYYDYVDNTVYFEGAFSSNIYYCLTDKDNSVVGVVDADGDIEYIAYDAWGTPNYTDDIQGLSVLWNGYYFDAETDNYYLRNRYYSPTERRFLTDDPHGIIPDENWNNPWDITNQYADGVGLQVYSGFNPITGRDDWGLSWFDRAIGIGYQIIPRNWKNSACGYQVYCREVKLVSPPWAIIGYLLPTKFKHCELRQGNGDGFFNEFYGVSVVKTGLLRYQGKSKSCSCATCSDISKCIKRHAYHKGIMPGDNCQSAVTRTINNCCLKTLWKPKWYSIPDPTVIR
jgi:RHS repeat-associated protein